jgi:hypothetical protein
MQSLDETNNREVVFFRIWYAAGSPQKCHAMTGACENKYTILLLVLAYCAIASNPKALGAFSWFNCLNILVSWSNWDPKLYLNQYRHGADLSTHAQ